MTASPDNRADFDRTAAIQTLAGCCLLSFALGALYAFSVMIAPIEARYDVSRAASSATFSIAIGAFSVAMVLAPLVYRLANLVRLMAIATAGAGLGLAVASLADTIWAVWLGYGVMFGLANGLAYNLALQITSLTWRARSGLATGLVVACYAFGALSFAPATRWIADAQGLAAAFLGLAALFVLCAVLVPWLARGAARSLDVSRLERRIADNRHQWRVFGLLLLAFGFGAGTEMMIIGHAAEIMAAAGGGTGAVMGIVGISAMAGATGRLGAGWLADIGLPVRFILGGAALPAGVGLAMLAAAPSPILVGAVLLVSGLAYGLLAGGLPAAVAQFFGPERLGTVYGQLFYGYGIAGLTTPYLAGLLFNRSGTYELALYAAAGMAMVTAVVGLSIKPDRA